MLICNTGEGIISLYSLSDVSREFGCTPQRVWKRVKAGSLPEPKVINNGRKYYTEEQYNSILRCETEKNTKIEAMNRKLK